MAKSTRDDDFIAALQAKAVEEKSSDKKGAGYSIETLRLNVPKPSSGRAFADIMEEQAAPIATTPISTSSGEEVVAIHVGMIDVSPYQPRLQVDEDALRRLAESIEADGQINPVVVRRCGERFQLVAGERRWRAIQLLNRPTLNAVIKDLSDKDAAVIAVADNDAREDLCDYERARKYKQLLDTGVVSSQSELARRIGRERTYIVRCMAYFKLPAVVLALLDDRPAFLSAKAAGDFSPFMDEGKSEYLVTEACKKVFDGKFDVQGAISWLKGQSRVRHAKMDEATHHVFKLDGRSMGKVRVEGRRIIIACSNDVSPDEVVSFLLNSGKIE